VLRRREIQPVYGLQKRGLPATPGRGFGQTSSYCRIIEILSIRRYFENLSMTFARRRVVDPSAIAGPAWPQLILGAHGQSKGLAALGLADVNIPVAGRVAIERDFRSVRRLLGTSRPAPKKVIWTGSEPSFLGVQISSFPVRSDSNAVKFPSGEYGGSDSIRVRQSRTPLSLLRFRAHPQNHRDCSCGFIA
jgi:hypothetical protein